MDVNSAYSARSTPSARKLVKHSGSLEIIQGDVNSAPACQSSSTGCFSPDTSSRPWSRCSVGSIPPRPDSSCSKGITTPVKQISLQAVRRKDESSLLSNDTDFKVSKYDILIKNTLDKLEQSEKYQQKEQEQLSKDQKPHHATKLRLPANTLQDQNAAKNSSYNGEDYTFDFISGIDVKSFGDVKISDDKGDSEEDKTSDNEESVSVERRAPNELLMEFIDCLMKKDYKTAEKLCQMILLFEPKNPEALKFQPLLQRKLKLDERATLAGEDDDDDDDDSSSDDESLDDSDATTSSDESSELDEEEADTGKDASQLSEQSKAAQNPARAILQMIFGGKTPEFINPDTNIDLAQEIKKLDEF